MIKKKTILLLVMAVCLTAMTGCTVSNAKYELFSRFPWMTKELDTIRYFCYRETTGTAAESWSCYEAGHSEDGTVTLTVHYDGEAAERTCAADENFMEALTETLRGTEIAAWDGFSRQDMGLMDGDSFSLYLVTQSGREVSASGYGCWPKDAGQVKDAFKPLFDSYFA